MARARVYTPPPETPVYRGPPDEHESGGRPWLIMTIMAIVLATSGYVLWTFYGGEDEGGVPTIEAEGAFKERYEGPPVDELATAEIDRALEGKSAAARPAPAPEEPAASILPAPRSAAAAAPKTPAVAAASPKAAGGGEYVVQVAALRSEGAADAAWERLARRDPALFANASKDVQRADLGGKGVYFRVRAGYFADRGEASRFCDRVKTLGQECIVVVR